MKKRERIVICVAVFLLGAAALLANKSALQQTPTRPNVVLITGDHLGTVHLAANGFPHMQTPNLDRLAGKGVTFRRFYTVGVACTPNRASLFTGRYPHAHGAMSNGIPLSEQEITLTHVLAQAGYHTGQMGKLHFWPHSRRNHRAYHPPYGFHEMRLSDEPGCYDDAYGLWLDAQGQDVREKARVAMPGERGLLEYYTFKGDEKTTHAYWVASETIRFIQSNKARPFFVHAGFYAPHPPLNPPASQVARYDKVVLPPRKVRPGEMERMPRQYQDAARRLAETREEVWTAYRKHFYAMVSNLDLNLGRIVEAVEQAGIADHTIFVVTSDHGDYLGNHGLVGKSSLTYDEALNIPLVMSGRGIPRRGRIEALAEVVDVMPTILDLVGIEAPQGIQGNSLAKVIAGTPGRDLVFMEGLGVRMIRSEAAKYAYHTDGSEVLFDLSQDPEEFNNIASEPQAKPLLDRMRKMMLMKLLTAADPLPLRIAPY